MDKKILFIIDKIEVKYFEFNKLITDFWLVKEFLQRNFEVAVTTTDRLCLDNSKAFCKCSKVTLKENNIFLDKNWQKQQIEDFAIVMFRPDPPVDLDYINSTYIFDFIDRQKTLIINDTKSIRDFNEKLHTNMFFEFMPKNLVTSSKKDILHFLEKHDQIILKPLNKCFGAGVMYLKKDDKNINSIINSMTDNQTSLVMVQEYISNANYGDKRILTLGKEILDECVIKLPGNNDFKFNTHSDEYIKKATLTESEKIKFQKVAKKLNEMGIFMAGLDVIDEKIIEINVTSPCYFIKEINNYFSMNLERKIANFLISCLSNKNKNNNLPLTSKNSL